MNFKTFFYLTPQENYPNLFKLKKLAVFFLLLSCIAPTAKANAKKHSQTEPTTFKVQGVVTDEHGKPLTNVSIIIKGTNKGTRSDEKGNYKIDVEKGNELEFSYVGYKNKTVKISGSATINIKMETDVATAAEVVIVGYGSQRKKDLTGAVAVLKVDNVDGATPSNFLQVMEGRVSGVQVSQVSGTLDGSFSVNVRGIGSLNSSSQPLYVVDGIPLFSGALSTINSNDIVSLNILKDASATAIYGSRAANGVVLISTKLGKLNSSKIVFTQETGIEKVAKLMKMLSSEDQRQLTFDAFTNSGLPTAGYDDPNDPLWKVDNNWQKLITRTGQRQNYNLGIYGGTEKTQYGISGNFLNRQGIIVNTGLQSWSLRANIDHKISNKFKVSAKLSGSYQQQKVNNNQGFLGGVMNDALETHSHNPLYDSLGNFTSAPTSSAPYWGANSNVLAADLENQKTLNDMRILGSLKMDYIITNGLTLSGTLGGDMLSENGRVYLPVFQRGVSTRPLGDLTQTTANQINWITDLTLLYEKKLNDVHDFSAMVGGSIQQFNNKITYINGTGTTNNLLNQLNNQTTFTASGSDISSGLASLFARLNYAYDSRYLLTATVRRDGSSKFLPGNRYGIFPSGSIGWRISKEKFYDSKIFTDLKIRTSYGLTGNQDIADFAYSTNAGPANYILGNSTVLGNAAINQGNSNLKWESSKQLDIGADAEFFYGRIVACVDYYDKRSDGLLVAIPLPATAGVSQQTIVNLGSVQNVGFEFSITSRNLVGKLKWTTDFNFSTNKNKVLDIGRNALGAPFQIPGTLDNFFSGITNQTEAGHPIGAFYMYQWDGIWQTKDAAGATAFSGARPGDMKYKDINGDGQFTADDKTYVKGNPSPTYYGGINNTFSYENWDLSVFINWAGGNKKINTVKFTHGGGWPFFQELAEMENRWTPSNPSNSIPAANQLGNSTFLATQMSTYYLQDASFMRLKNISISYPLNKTFLQKKKLEAVKFMLSASNLFTLTKYEGYDPEAASLGNQLSAGIDYAPYPLSKIYTLSVQVAFQ